jgi:alpha-L-fucosidase
MPTRHKEDNEFGWFRNAGFGMFIHWGVYSVIGRGEWCKFQEQIPDDEYWSYAPKFKAQKYNPEEWVKLAKEAGMKYMVLTTKHHDGYCLFRTETTALNSVNVGSGKDLVGEFVTACRKHKMKTGLYFSLPDWSKPAFFDGPETNPEGWQEFIEYTHAQVQEIMSNYGKIDLLWYDNILGQSGNRQLNAEDYKSEKLNTMVRKLQPGIIINDRSLLSEDFYTAEQNAKPPEDKNRLWEACMTMNKHWGNFPADKIWKSPAEIVNILTGCAASEGNLLLNIGPLPDGSIPEPNVKNLKAVGKWLRIHGESIYGAQRCSVNAGTSGVFTRKENVLYLLVHWWHGTQLILPDFSYEIKNARILNLNQTTTFRRDGKRIIFENLPEKAPDPLCSVIVIEIKNTNCTHEIQKEIPVNFREQK